MIVDINTAFSRNRVSNTVVTVSQKDAVKQFIYNLIALGGEIPFQEWKDSGLQSLLGESCNNVNGTVICEQVKQLIIKYVKYVELQEINFKIDPENQIYVIYLFYNIIGSPDKIEQELNLSVHN